MTTPARTIEEVLTELHKQLDTLEMKNVLESVAFSRRVDITLYIDRGIIGVKPPSLRVT